MYFLIEFAVGLLFTDGWKSADWHVGVTAAGIVPNFVTHLGVCMCVYTWTY